MSQPGGVRVVASRNNGRCDSDATSTGDAAALTSVANGGEFDLPNDAMAPLQRFDSLLRAATVSEHPRMSEIARHLIEAGGRRFRPTLVLACAVAIAGPDGVTPRVMDAAIAVELFHLASLYHDDVLDAAPRRRGWPSANAMWGNERAVLGGDALLAHAYRVAASLGPPELRRLSATSLQVCCGQIAECDQRFERARSVADYKLSVRGKTAALLSTSCWLGATTAGADDTTAEALARYGTEIGIAFQIVDDLKDLCGDSGVIGKPTGNDLREGVYTLPVLLGIHHDPSLAELLTADIDDRAISEVRDRVRAGGAARRAYEHAVAHVEAATSHLAPVALQPQGRRALNALAGEVVEQLARLAFDDPPARSDGTATAPAP